jgi:N utilization substance protein B
MGKPTPEETSELDRLRAEFLAEQSSVRPPATSSQHPAPSPAPITASGRKVASPRPLVRPRTGARLAAVQALYQSEHNNEPAEVVIEQFLRHRLPTSGAYEEGQVPDANAKLFAEIVRHAARDGAAIDTVIARHLDAGWPLVKLDPVLRALLRAAVAELHAGRDPPAKVVINEYLDVAHGFFGGDEPRFANGVLNALARSLRPGEFSGAGR